MANFYKSELFRKYNVGIVCKLRHKASGKEFILATTHLHWNPVNDYVKYAQMCKMFETIEGMDKRVKTDEIPVLLCGDMNSAQDSTVFAFIDKKPIKPYKSVKDECKHLYDAITFGRQTQNLVLPGKFKSSYSLYPQKDANNKTIHKFPEFTCYTKGHHGGVIDHIYYTDKHFDVVSLLELPKKEYVEEGLPNALFPSDHLRIEAVLRLK